MLRSVNTWRTFSARPLLYRLTGRPHSMASASTGTKPYLSHVERTADSPRDDALHPVTIHRVEQPVPHVRLLQLRINDAGHGIEFQPGQWLDVHIPDISEAGGFTIVSPPCAAVKQKDPSVPTSRVNGDNEDFHPYIELAIQRSPKYGPAAWIWQEKNPDSSILGTTLHVRVGGDFVWPPSNQLTPERAVFIAGGVGINPFMSMLTHMNETNDWPKGGVTLMYGSKSNTHHIGQDQMMSNDVLFWPELLALANENSLTLKLELFFTEITPSNIPTSPTKQAQPENDKHIIPQVYKRRMNLCDVQRVLDEHNDDERPDNISARSTIVYVCGPQAMTDSFVEGIKRMNTLRPKFVLCEKWW